MPLDLGLFAKKLARYRQQFQADYEEVSQNTGIPREKLIALEQASLEPTGDDILILADYFKCDYKFFVSNEMLAPFEQTETLFRMYGDELSSEDRWAIQEFLFLCECEDYLLSQGSARPTRPFSFAKRGRYYKKQGVEAAGALRNHLGYRGSEVASNVYDDFRKAGIHVFRRSLKNSRISGLYIKHPTAGKCVLVNYDEDIYRQRFTVSHEGGHAILDDERDVSVSFQKWDSKDLSEIRANAFAASYLIPSAVLEAIPDKTSWSEPKAVDWANRLKVNTGTLANALGEGGFIDKEAERLIKSCTVPKELKVDPELPSTLTGRSRARKTETLKRGLSDSYVRLCFEAYHGGVVTSGRLAEMLLVAPYELPKVAKVYGRSLYYAS